MSTNGRNTILKSLIWCGLNMSVPILWINPLVHKTMVLRRKVKHSFVQLKIISSEVDLSTKRLIMAKIRILDYAQPRNRDSKSDWLMQLIDLTPSYSITWTVSLQALSGVQCSYKCQTKRFSVRRNCICGAQHINVTLLHWNICQLLTYCLSMLKCNECSTGT